MVANRVKELLSAALRPETEMHDGIPDLLKRVFLQVDQEVIEQPEPQWEDSAGCTGIVAVLDFRCEEVWVAHVGDSRAILYEPEANRAAAAAAAAEKPFLFADDRAGAAHPREGDGEKPAIEMVKGWESEDHTSSVRSFGHRLRKASATPPTAEPDLKSLKLKDGAVLLLTSDGLLNAYTSPEEAVKQVGVHLSDMRREGRLHQNVLQHSAALQLLQEAEKVCSKRHEEDMSRFVRDDMCACVLSCQRPSRITHAA